MKRNIKNTVILLVGFILTCQTAYSQKTERDVIQFNPVYTGVTSLSIAPDSRAGAMGDVGCATDPYMDNNSQYWNPSKYPFTKSQAGFSFCYTPWLRKLVNDIDLANLTGYYKLDDYSALSGSLTYFSLGEVFVIDGSGAGNVIIHPYEMALDFDYSASSLRLSRQPWACVLSTQTCSTPMMTMSFQARLSRPISPCSIRTT